MTLHICNVSLCGHIWSMAHVFQMFSLVYTVSEAAGGLKVFSPTERLDPRSHPQRTGRFLRFHRGSNQRKPCVKLPSSGASERTSPTSRARARVRCPAAVGAPGLEERSEPSSGSVSVTLFPGESEKVSRSCSFMRIRLKPEHSQRAAETLRGLTLTGNQSTGPQAEVRRSTRVREKVIKFIYD